ncbi:MAG: aldo/keto reductase, partial [Candidatus Latescibacteria bacterium]|nr:aldo/keto reductase [Candidatus Latescibacterota bacterium]
ELMRDVLAECDDFVSVITFLKYDMLVQTAREILLPTAAARDVAVILASPLHAGLLGSKRDAWMAQGRYADLYPKLEKLEALLADEEGDMPDHGLRYLLSDPRVSVILTGAATTDELATSTAVSDGRHLSRELIAKIESIS